jgi:mono/diheme cytochrome c family protein/DNA-binding beta-propeller fold protein YncE
MPVFAANTLQIFVRALGLRFTSHVPQCAKPAIGAASLLGSLGESAVISARIARGMELAHLSAGRIAMRQRRVIGVLCCALALAQACSGTHGQSKDDPQQPAPSHHTTQTPDPSDPDTDTDPDMFSNPPGSKSTPVWMRDPDEPLPPLPPTPTLTNLTLNVPTDKREPKVPAIPAVPITGGTLITTADGKYAVAADPDRDRVSVVDVLNASVVHTVALEAGDEPGRLALDDQGRVHVALRRAGSVVSIDLESGTVLQRRAVCPAPRGIAFDANAGALRVACASGELVTLPVDSGDASASVHVDADLRDVLITGDRVLVSRFKRAELLQLDANDGVKTRLQPGSIPKLFNEASGSQIADVLEPEIAWRTVSIPSGGTIMLHQGARSGEIGLADPKDVAANTAAPQPSTGPYGGGPFAQCASVVQPEISQFDDNGEVVWTSMISATLAVDIAVSPDSSTLAVAQAGEHDQEQPAPSLVVGDSADVAATNSPAPGSGTTGSVMLLALGSTATFACAGALSVNVPGQVTAVAYVPDGTLLAQTREPATITVIQNNMGAAQIDLGGDSVYDTGHELFHRDAGAGIACASCHAEGTDDGHVWRFSGVGPRRTQSVNVGLEGTAPFHWSGDLDSVADLMEDVFVTRMGGVHESKARSNALQSWLFALKPLPAQRAADDAAALRGQALFEGDAQCSTCHSGPKLTNNASVDVGTGEALQVPSLRGIGYRAPLIHDGCAATLRDRFDPKCGGDKHGKTDQLSSDQVDDLIAYLQTL